VEEVEIFVDPSLYLIDFTQMKAHMKHRFESLQQYLAAQNGPDSGSTTLLEKVAAQERFFSDGEAKRIVGEINEALSQFVTT
jgi:predicted ATPase